MLYDEDDEDDGAADDKDEKVADDDGETSSGRKRAEEDEEVAVGRGAEGARTPSSGRGAEAGEAGATSCLTATTTALESGSTDRRFLEAGVVGDEEGVDSTRWVT